MANKKNKYTPIRKPKPEGSNNVTLATRTRSSESAADKKKAMIQQINDLGTEDIMTVIRGRPIAELGLQKVGMKNMTNLVEAHEGYELPVRGLYSSSKGENPLIRGRGDHDPSSKDHHRGKYHHSGAKEFRKQGKEFVSIPIEKQTSPSSYRKIAAHEYLHAGQERLSSEAKGRLDGSLKTGREAVALLQDTKSRNKKESKVARAGFKHFKDPTKALAFAKEWLPIQNREARFLLEKSWQKKRK
jgi:hypothetical protein